MLPWEKGFDCVLPFETSGILCFLFYNYLVGIKGDVLNLNCKICWDLGSDKPAPAHQKKENIANMSQRDKKVLGNKENKERHGIM